MKCVAEWVMWSSPSSVGQEEQEEQEEQKGASISMPAPRTCIT